MDAEDPPSASGTPRKSLLRSATWTARSSSNPNPNPNPNRPPKPGRLALPPPPPLASWPCPASDDSGHLPATPSSSAAAAPSRAAADGGRDISRVDDHVYLGGDAASRDRAALRRHGITHVLNCAGAACPDHFRGELAYRTLWLRDSPAEDLAPVLYDAFDFLEGARAAPRGRALVHCRRGASRSAALVVAYLMWRRSLSFDDALRAVRAARPSADPNLGFAAQLLRCQRRVLALPPTPGSTALRAYRMAPQSPYDPLYLVPKSIDLGATAGGGFLDSRGAFVVHVPDTIYVWLGLGCEPAMAAAAATAAHQIVRYERVDGPIITIHEGFEPASFWAALTDPSSPSPENLVGKRRVEVYDLDYDIFRRATAKGQVESPLPMPWAGAETRSPVKQSGWSRLRRKFASSGLKEIINAVLERRSFHHEELQASDASRSPGSFSVESSTTPSSTSADSASVLSTFSPNSSSSSDWYNLSPPRSELNRTPQNELNSELQSSSTENVKGKDQRSLAERRGSNAPSLVLLPSAGDAEGRLSSTDIVRDWCSSPPFISTDQETLFIEGRLSLAASEHDDIAEDETSCADEHDQLIHPVLFRWPDMDKVEDVSSGVLDHESVFLLLASESKLGSRRPKKKKIYVWLGRDSGDDISGGKEEDVHIYLDTVGTQFFDLMGIPVDTAVQIIREGEEPEQFLNHLFSFHQAKESSPS